MTVREPDKQHLATVQYRDASNLNARASLHARFGANEHPWFRWLFDQFARLTPNNAAVLEVGAGPGALWRDNLDRTPAGWKVTLTDLSEGMVDEERRAISHPAFTCTTADVESLPFDDNTVDVVIANHMLYHVPDRPKALSEVRRVLRPGGAFIAATTGEHNMREMSELLLAVAPDKASAHLRNEVFYAFTLEKWR
ncbi:MAG TPA: class I SAM-dependent methyltransferase [Ktedonobacterales bacterium]